MSQLLECPCCKGAKILKVHPENDWGWVEVICCHCMGLGMIRADNAKVEPKSEPKPKINDGW